MNIVPEIKEITVSTVFGKQYNCIVVPATQTATNAVRLKYIEEQEKAQQRRESEKRVELFVESIKKMGKTKDDLIRDIVNMMDSDFYVEAESMIDKDHPDYKEKIKSTVDKLAEEERKKLASKNIAELREEFADKQLTRIETFEIITNAYSTMLYHCVRLADNPKKKLFDSPEDIDDSITEKTKEFLMSEYDRVNKERSEEQAKN